MSSIFNSPRKILVTLEKFASRLISEQLLWDRNKCRLNNYYTENRFYTKAIRNTLYQYWMLKLLHSPNYVHLRYSSDCTVIISVF